MYKKTHPLFLICETPLHAGSGDDLGIVDLPIQRERHTSFPKIESSSLKGALREAFEEKANNHRAERFNDWNDADVKVQRIFGFDDGSLDDKTKNSLKARFRYKARTEDREEKDNNEFSGCVALTDARILLFPVKSMKGVFVWITCPQVLNRLESDLTIAGSQTLFQHLSAVSNLSDTDGSALVSNKNKVAFGENIILEEFAFSAIEHESVKQFASELADTVFSGDELRYWNETLKNNLVILGNNDFRDFVNLSTEVVTRTKIDNVTGTVQEGALFTEEYLPNDSVMYSLAVFSDEYTKKTSPNDKMNANGVSTFFKETLPPIFQLGGNATIGKGLLRTRFIHD